ncbi:MAG: hypothetical protein JRC89_13000 [Deltaproteobacteria bacterium]|nr:hypothetical protein [Deltaproteobacteria bacterium]
MNHSYFTRQGAMYDSNASTLGSLFLTYADSDFEEVKDVLSNMLERLNPLDIQKKEMIRTIAGDTGF